MKKEGKMSFSIFIFIYTISLAYLKVYTTFENTGFNRSREICDRKFHWRERKNINTGTDMQYVAVLCYTIQIINIKLCTKFQMENEKLKKRRQNQD